jgi:hypothetical protein
MSRLFTECILACRGVVSSLIAGVNRFADYFVRAILPVQAATRELTMTQGTVQLVAGILAVALIAIVILRRKGKKSKGDDEEF